MAGYAEFVARSLTEAPPTEIGDRAIARLHAEFGSQLGEILAAAESMEEAWHHELRRPRQDPFEPGTGELVILRQWPSYATFSLLPYPDEVAGGYLLRWEDRNLVIDPGLGFLGALRQAGFHLADIDGVLITHWHIDHTGDMEELLASLFEANEDDPIAQVDFFLPPGAFGVYASLLAHNPGAQTVQLLRAGDAVDWGRMRLTSVGVGHRDLTGTDRGAMGLRVDLSAATGRLAVAIGLTSDTRWAEDLVEPLSEVDLLVLHLGGIYSRDLKPGEYAKNHLGVKGAASLLSALVERKPPRLGLISEIGKELQYERVRLTRILSDVSGCPLCPAELGMRIMLPEVAARCDGPDCERLATRWGLDPHDRNRICYRCDDCHAPRNGG